MNIYENLPKTSFNGIEFPIEKRSFEFNTDTVTHRLIFRDEELIETIGRKNPTFTYDIPFVEGIKFYNNLFTITYPKFLVECKKRERGLLIDPIHGQVYVKCMSISETSDLEMRSGVRVSVSFVKAPNEDELAANTENQVSLGAAADQIRAFGEDPTVVQIEQQSAGQYAEQDFFSAIAGVFDQIDVAQNKVLANIDSVFDKIDRVDKSIEKAKDPKLNRIQVRAKRLKSTLLRIPSTLELDNRKIDAYQVQTDIDLISLSGKLKNRVSDLIKLNGLLARDMKASRGTIVRYYRSVGIL